MKAARWSWGVVLLGLPVLSSGCTDGFLFGPEADSDPETTFEVLWNEVDRHYSFFAEKGVDWDEVYAIHRPRIGPETPPQDLFKVLTEMLETLRDGHVSLLAPGIGNWAWDGWIRPDPKNYAAATVRSYLIDGWKGTPGGRITYGRLTEAIGYIHIRDFRGEGWAGDIDRALEALADVEALVVDVRGNRGGTDNLSYPIAGRFADRSRLAMLAYYRDGPAHDDFSDPIERRVAPAGPRQFTGPTVLLTDRAVFSTGESFVLHLRVLPHVTVVGDTTGGGAGNPIGRELPNGWGFRISRWRVTTPDGFSYEGWGLPPDEPVWISEEDRNEGRDTILERAISLLGR